MAGKQSLKYHDFWQMLGGERFYTLARWVLLILVFAISLPTLKGPLWPPSMSSEPLVFVLWAYAVFALVMSIFLFIPPLLPALKQAYIYDILFI